LRGRDVAVVRPDWDLVQFLSRRCSMLAGAQPGQLLDDLMEPLAPDVLHRVIVVAPLLADLEDRDDVGMVQPRGSASLPPKALPQHRLLGGLQEHDLQGHESTERELLGLVHPTHPPSADPTRDAIVAELIAGRQHRLAGRMWITRAKGSSRADGT